MLFKCTECGNGVFIFSDTIDGIDYYECDNCGWTVDQEAIDRLFEVEKTEREKGE